MFKTAFKIVSVAFLALQLTACAKIIEKTIENNPDIVINVMKKDPVKFLDAFNEAVSEYRVAKRAEEEKKAKDQMEDQFKNPVTPKLENRAFQGPEDAPITIVEYADFQCGHCGRAHETIKTLMEKEYKGKIKYVFKNLPVTGAPMSVPAAKTFEALALVDADKAYEFLAKIFENQGALGQGGQKYLDKTVKALVGSKASAVKEKLDSEEVQQRMAADRAEAQEYEISGTPAFVVNGVFLKGAYPIDSFKEVIDRHLSAKK